MNKIIFIVLTSFFISCKNKSENKSTHAITNKGSVSVLTKDSFTTTDASFSNKKTNKNQIEFLNFIDESLIFQDAIINDYLAHAFVCHGDEKEMKFSGKIYLTPSASELENWKDFNYRASMIDSINNIFSNKETHERFTLWAQITPKDNFLPLEDWVDNPCEYYKKDRTVIIYKSDKGQKHWTEIEKTKNTERIEEILKLSH
ncbi:hypothetical protein [Psychroserpens sp. NJDZ02]|uniref:hypothetical protein n=1 Tax=Psychroserpens sp. NJDZ02 TaxID=2570561 RepID=UPI0010A822B2|nr:hypothetical protein [Psychroserpens sp. NJDZ02]QCE43436.1 hypothetical protein E9099_19085 [Psychroserpens sp. NJDZ02]